VPSSSLAQSSPAGERVATPGSLLRPLEIEESPEPTSAGALNPDHHNIEDSPLFVPQDSPLVIPSQDLAFVRPSEPPSSYQEYLETSQLGVPQSLPNSASTPPPAGESAAADTPAVLATSQNEDPANHTPGQPSTGRVIPDSQSLPTSLDFVSQPQANQDTADSQEAAAASQLIGDLQGAAEDTIIASPSKLKTALVVDQSQDQPSSLPTNTQSLPVPPKSLETPTSPANPGSEQQSHLLPELASLGSSSFAAVPSCTLSNIEESAPLPPVIPSTPERSSIERTWNMEGKTPTPGSKLDMKALIRAEKAKRAARRAAAAAKPLQSSRLLYRLESTRKLPRKALRGQALQNLPAMAADHHLPYQPPFLSR
jgi:hypothetical protein